MKPREILLESSLGDSLLLRRMHGHEELGRPFVYSLELLSLAPVQAEQVLGLPMTVKLGLPGDDTRYFHGYTTELALMGAHGRYLRYQATLRPWIWLLSLTSNCRIFQQKTVPDVIKQIFRDRGFTDIEDALTDSYRNWEYLAQYCETDFDFVSRLMEREGIYYYFKHEASRHTLVLADGYGAHQPLPGDPEVQYFVPDKDAYRERDYFDRWQCSQSVVSGSYVLEDYDFKRPSASLEAKLEAPRQHAHADYEHYSYPGKYVENKDGDNQACVRLQELQVQAETFEAAGMVPTISAGALFKLIEFPHPDQNQEYLVVRAEYVLNAGDWESQTELDTSSPYRCTVTSIKSKSQFRLERRTQRPIIAGHQTAKVVGKQGQELWTDEFGRVKVQFPWDREGKSDENSSCWIRVAQVWAGNGFGSIHIPRIGEEVLISFLEGDPDRPIITGRVYNGARKAPFPLPIKAMVSGTKSESTLGGSGYNELSMDDTKDQELFILHAQRDLEERIERNHTATIGGDVELSITGSSQETVKGAKSVDVTQSIDLVCGASSIRITPANITVTAPAISLVSEGAVSVTAGGAVNISSGGAATVTAGGTIAVTGTLITITGKTLIPVLHAIPLPPV